MFCDEDDEGSESILNPNQRPLLGGKKNITIRSALTKPEINTEGGTCCVESSRPSKMTSRDLGGFNSELHHVLEI